MFADARQSHCVESPELPAQQGLVGPHMRSAIRGGRSDETSAGAAASSASAEPHRDFFRTLQDAP